MALRASQVVQVVKNLPANAGDARDSGSIPGSGRSPGVENGNLLQYSCWKIPWTEEPGKLQSLGSLSQTRLKRLSSSSSVVRKRFPGGASGKEPACQCRGCKRRGFNPWVRKIPWRRAWQPTPVFLLENPMDRGAWWATVHGVAKSRT